MRSFKGKASMLNIPSMGIMDAAMVVESTGRPKYKGNHVAKHDRVWICRSLDLANHGIATHPYRAS